MTTEERQDFDITKFIEEWRAYNVPMLPVPYGLGHPVIPWISFQTNPPVDYKEFSFEDICIMPGPTTDDTGRLLIVLDSDTPEATNKLLKMIGCSVKELAAKTRVERHSGTPDKIHVFFFTRIKFESKTKFREGNIFKLETRADRKYLVNVAPSINAKDKTRYEVIGTHKIAEAGIDLRELLKRFYSETDEPYIDNGIMKTKSKDYIAFNFANTAGSHDDFYLDLKEKITSSRNDTMRDIFSIYVNDHWGNTKESMVEWALRYNDRNCHEPLSRDEIVGLIHSRLKYINECKEQEKKEQLVTEEDTEFVINTLVKEAEHDRTSIEQLFYGMNTTFTLLPMPHKVNSKEAGAGKSYLLNKTAGIFPEQRVIILAGASDKAILHRHGTMVIKNPETGILENVTPMIESLEDELEILTSVEKKQQDKAKIKEIGKQIKFLKNNAKKLINLQNTIIVIQDTPSESLLVNVLSLLSQDSERDQEYDYVDKTGGGQIINKSNILRGMPVLFTTRVIDDTRNTRFEEINRRAVNVAPSVSKEKIDSAVGLIFKRNFLPPELYDRNVVSRQDKIKAKQITDKIVDKLIEHTKGLKGTESGIIPLFGGSVSHCIPTAEEDNWAMTSSERLARYLAIVTKVHMDSRPRFVNTKTGVNWIIPTFKDLKKALELMKVGGSNVRPYVVDWYEKVFKPAYAACTIDEKIIQKKDHEGKEFEITITEDREGLKTPILAEKTAEVLHISKPSSDTLLSKYLYPLKNQGIIDSVPSKLDKRANIWFPADESRNISSLFANNDDLRLQVNNETFYPTKEGMTEFAELVLSTESIEKSIVSDPPIENKIYRLLDPEGNEITPKELVEKYLFDPDLCFKHIIESSDNEAELALGDEK